MLIRHREQVPVLYPDMSLAFMANSPQTERLLKTRCVVAERQDTTERDEEPKAIQYLVLCVSLGVARCVMGRSEPLKAQKVTRMRQDPGSGRWVQRADQAGRGAGTLPVKTLHFKLAHAKVERSWGQDFREIAS